jgi:hypothetical protein
VTAYLIPLIEIVIIKPWLEAKLKARGITAHKFASEMRVTSATIYRWYSDQYRPTCAALRALQLLPSRQERCGLHPAWKQDWLVTFGKLKSWSRYSANGFVVLVLEKSYFASSAGTTYT